MAYTHLIIGRFLAVVHTQSALRCAINNKCVLGLERFYGYGDSTRSNSISQRDKLLVVGTRGIFDTS
jgi:hypothetical protein